MSDIKVGMSSSGIVAIVVGLLTALGTALTILSRYVTAETFAVYKEANITLYQMMDKRSERMETKLDALLTKNGIVIIEKDIKPQGE